MIQLFEHSAVAVCAISGVLAAEGKKVDLFAVIVLAMVTAFGGGTLRDVLLRTEVVWIARTEFLHTAGITALVTFFAARHWNFPLTILLIADAAGLALFTVLGTRKALQLDAPPAVAIALGVMTGVAGGMLRDTLLREIPLVFRREINLYATAAFAGAALYAFLPRTGWHNETIVSIASIAVIFTLRLAAIRWKIRLPDFRTANQPGE